MIGFKKRIICYIESQYKACFINKLELTYNNGCFDFKIWLHEGFPFHMIKETDDIEEMYKFVCQELNARNFITTQYVQTRKQER